MEKVLGKIVVEEVVDNPDGTSTIIFNISDEAKENIKNHMGWKRWSDKKFNQLVIESLERELKTQGGGLLDGEKQPRPTNASVVDPFDNGHVIADKGNE
jgi:hypothetical protein